MLGMGKDRNSFWLNPLLFNCPIPELFQPLLSSTSPKTESSKKGMNNRQQPVFYVDLIPIRTPVRSKFLFMSNADESLVNDLGKNKILPPMDDAGRWQNLPICRRSDTLLPLPGKSNRDQSYRIPLTNTTSKKEKHYRLVACTWTSSSYRRRGESFSVSDSVERLKEWIQFHLMVGFDHLYIYDNTHTDGIRNLSVLYNLTRNLLAGIQLRVYSSTKAKTISSSYETNISPIVCSIALCALFHRDNRHTIVQ